MALSPMMQQYMAYKEQYKDALLFFRLGDFYEMFFEDAKTASRELGLTLTGRDCGEEERAPMCGVPYHAADSYIGRLVAKGYKVVICEQMENPATAKGIVRRDVVRIVTPGTVTDETQLDATANNYLCAVYLSPGEAALAIADISTGDLFVTAVSGEDFLTRAMNELAGYAPKEVILNASTGSYPTFDAFLKERLHARVSDGMLALFAPENTGVAVRKHARDRKELHSASPSQLLAMGALFSYIDDSLKCDSFLLKSLQIYAEGQYLALDGSTRRNLELCETMRDAQKKGSLLYVLDKTKTAMGARLLRKNVEMPLISLREICRRHDAVEELAGDYMLREELGEVLRNVLDLDRLLTKVLYGSAGGKELRSICDTLKMLPEVKKLLSGATAELLCELRDDADLLEDVRDLLDCAIKQKEIPFSVREGGFIADGYHEEVDRLRSITGGAKELLEKMEARERERTGIRTLRVSRNRVFGYYIEVSKSFMGQVPENYVRRQTLTGGERYVTKELKELEERVLGASDKLSSLEYELFRQLCEVVAGNAERIRRAASMFAEIDFYLSLATVAMQNSYVRPEMTLEDVLEIKDGRHPVVEKHVSDSYFVPNDTLLSAGDHRLMIITGPNMAGKSTYMRQIALIVIMAQIGSFVPAAQAKIGVVDKVFTRVGASDDLASGQSTFMLEMNEVSYILKNATRRSLVIYDEIGRGTATYDGMSIARAVAEYTLKRIGAKTLFATHYHELTVLEEELPGAVNYRIVAKKKGDTLVFLRKIVPGGADESYGIEVAKLAGVPNEVVRRAREVLHETVEGLSVPPAGGKKAEEEPSAQLPVGMFDPVSEEIAERVRSTDINTLTPIEALNLIYELKKLQK